MAGWVQAAYAAYSIYDSNRQQRRLNKDLLANKPGAAPTIDEAAMRQQEMDKLRRRRGAFSNIYGGAKGEKPAVDVKTLIGGNGLLAG